MNHKERLKFFANQIERDEIDSGNPDFFPPEAKIFLQEVLESIQKVEITKAERQICFGLFLGLTAKEIGKGKGCSNRTVENHIANVKRKLNVTTIAPMHLQTIINSNHSEEVALPRAE